MYSVLTTNKFRKWLDDLPEYPLRHRVTQRIRRMGTGNLGDIRNLKGGVWEARIFAGPGLRLYFSLSGNEIIILLAGGDKSSQQADIELARELANEVQHGTGT